MFQIKYSGAIEWCGGSSGFWGFLVSTSEHNGEGLDEPAARVSHWWHTSEASVSHCQDYSPDHPRERVTNSCCHALVLES